MPPPSVGSALRDRRSLQTIPSPAASRSPSGSLLPASLSVPVGADASSRSRQATSPLLRGTRTYVTADQRHSLTRAGGSGQYPPPMKPGPAAFQFQAPQGI